MSNIDNFFKDHIAQRMRDADNALNALNYSSLILGSGEPFTYFEDDTDADFKPNPHFAHWCPASGPHHLIKYETGKKPLLVYYSPDDFWHQHEQLGQPYWADCFDIIEVHTLDKLWPSLGDLSYSVFIGNETKYATALGVKTNCQFMTARLNWYRRFKSQYEIHCLSEANRLGAAGHIAAKNAFFAGASEYETHMAYLQAMGAVDCELPYSGIVAFDKNAAILHYHGKEKKRGGKVLLIDSGAKFKHYASDITRTYAQKNCDPTFIELLQETEKMQLELCALVKPGFYYPSLHEICHQKIAAILEKVGILKMQGDNETAVKSGVTKVFLPHGIGHMLGVQVHDIGGKQLDIQGNPAPENPANVLYRSLRFVGSLEEGVVVTIEPGIYFIPTLLKKFKDNHKYSSSINWSLVDKLTPLGGIRIEDDILATGSSHKNLTREHLP